MATKPATKTLFDDDKTIEHDPTERTKGGQPKRGPGRRRTKTEVTVIQKPERAPPMNLLAVIANAAADKRVDVAKMKELLAMQRDIEQRDAERAYNVAMHAAQLEMPRIAKDKQADRFKYATLEKVSRDIDPIARKHGFVLSYGHREDAPSGGISLYVDVMHTGGCVRRHFAPDLKPDNTGLKGEPNKTSTQGSGASISYMRRYLKLMVFDVVIEGEDIDGAKRVAIGGLIDDTSVIRLTELCEAAGLPIERFIARMNEIKPKGHPDMERIADLPKSRERQAIEQVNAYEANRRQKETKGASASNAERG